MFASALQSADRIVPVSDDNDKIHAADRGGTAQDATSEFRSIDLQNQRLLLDAEHVKTLKAYVCAHTVTLYKPWTWFRHRIGVGRSTKYWTLDQIKELATAAYKSAPDRSKDAHARIMTLLDHIKSYIFNVKLVHEVRDYIKTNFPDQVDSEDAFLKLQEVEKQFRTDVSVDNAAASKGSGHQRQSQRSESVVVPHEVTLPENELPQQVRDFINQYSWEPSTRYTAGNLRALCDEKDKNKTPKHPLDLDGTYFVQTMKCDNQRVWTLGLIRKVVLLEEQLPEQIWRVIKSRGWDHAEYDIDFDLSARCDERFIGNGHPLDLDHTYFVKTIKRTFKTFWVKARNKNNEVITRHSTKRMWSLVLQQKLTRKEVDVRSDGESTPTPPRKELDPSWIKCVRELPRQGDYACVDKLVQAMERYNVPSDVLFSL